MFKFGLLLLTLCWQAAGANDNKSHHFPPPPSRAQIEACYRMAQVKHPGMIEYQRVLGRHGGYWIQYKIHILGGSMWSIVCDLANGGIIRDERVVENKS